MFGNLWVNLYGPLLIITLHFIFGERIICSTLKKSKNIKNMILDKFRNVDLTFELCNGIVTNEWCLLFGLELHVKTNSFLLFNKFSPYIYIHIIHIKYIYIYIKYIYVYCPLWYIFYIFIFKINTIEKIKQIQINIYKR